MKTKSNSPKPFSFIAIVMLFCLKLTTLEAQCPTVSSPNQTFCDIESLRVDDLQAQDNGNGVVWYETATSTFALPGNFPLTNGEDYFADDNSGTCGTRQRVEVTIFGPPTGQNFQGFCVDDASSVTLEDLNVSGNDVQWYSSNFDGNALPLNTILVDGVTYFADQASPVTGCRTSRLGVSVTVGVVPVPTGDTIQEFCASPSSTPLVSDLVATGNNNWYPSLFSNFPIDPSTPLINGQIYYATSVDAPCQSSGRLAVLAIVIDSPDPGTDGNLDICNSDSPVDLINSLGGTPDSSGTWFPALDSGTGVFNPSIDPSGVYTYTVAGVSPCPDESASVTVTVIEQPDAGDDASFEICSNDSNTYDLFSILGGTPDSGGFWTPALASGTNVFNPALDSPGSYTYTVGNTLPCPDTATVTITEITESNAGINGILEICASDSAVDLLFSLGGSPDPGGIWSPALASGTGVFDPVLDTAGDYTYTVTGTTPCPDVSATVTVITVAESNAGTDGILEICSNESPIDLFLSLGGTPDSGGTWSPSLASGTGIFDPMLDTAGIYTYTVAGAAPCPDASANITVSVIAEATAGTDGTLDICSNDTTVDLFASLGGTPDTGGTWSPSLNSGTGVFDPTLDAPGIYTYTVTGTAPCPDASANITVTIIAEPNAGTDGTLEVCSNESPIDLFLSLGGTPDTGGTWSPSLASGTGIFDPMLDTAGIYTYTVAGTAPCPDASANVTVSVIAEATAGTDGTLDICSNDTTVDLFASLGGTPDTGGTWSPALANGTGVFDPALDTAGVYTYTVAGTAPCPDASANITVTIITQPNAGTDGTLDLCANDSSVDLFSSLGGTPDAGGTWSPALASGTGVFDPMLDTAGIYTYTVTGTIACPDDTATVTVSILAEANAGTDDTLDVCSNDTPVDLFASLGGTPDTGGTWSPSLASSTGVFDPSIDTAGVYTYTVAGVAPCPDASATVTVSILADPNAGTDGTLDICSSDTPVDLFLSLGGTPDTGGTWSPALASGTGVFDPAIDPSGDYTYTVGTVCTESAIVTVTTNPEANAGSDGSLIVCDLSTTYDLLLSLDGSPDTGGTWSPALASGSGIFDPAVDTAGTYTYTVAGTLPCPDASASVEVSFTVLPNAGEDGSIELCVNDSPVDLFLSIGGTPESGGTWSPALTSETGVFDPTLDSPGTYLYTIGPDDCGNSDTAEVIVTLSALPNAGSDGTLDICSNDTPVDLFASLGGTPDTGGTWSPALASGTGVFDPALDAPGIYTYTVGPDACNNTAESQVTVGIIQAPDLEGLDINIDPINCLNESIFVELLNANSLTNGTYTIVYNLSGANVQNQTVDINFIDGSALFEITEDQVPNTGTTIFTLSSLSESTGNCFGNIPTNLEETFEIESVLAPELAESEVELCREDNPKVSDLNGLVLDDTDVLWYDAVDSTEPLSEDTSLTGGFSYYAATISLNGCESEQRISIFVDIIQCDQTVVVPDGFSPNGDGINDVLEIKNLRLFYPNFRLYIYNRYGSIVYKGSPATADWDGTSNQGSGFGSGVLPVGVYFFALELNDDINEPIQGRIYLNR